MPHAVSGATGGKSPRWPLVAVIVLEVLQLISLAPWLLVAGFAVMAFDAPGSMQQWQPWAFVIAVWTYPLWLLAAGAASWLLIARGNRIAAMAISIAVTLPPLIAAALMLA